MKAPLSFKITLTDASGNEKMVNEYKGLSEDDVLNMEEVIGIALVAAGREGLKQKK